MRGGPRRAVPLRDVVERDSELVASGWTTHATVDATTHRPTRVPAWFVEKIVSAEATAPTM